MMCRDDGSIEVVGEQGFRVDDRLDRLRISDRLGNTPRQFLFDDGSKFETLDNDAVDRLLQRGGKGGFSLFIHRMETKFLYIAVLVMLSVLAGWWFTLYGVPTISVRAAVAIPVGVLDQLSEQVVDTLDEHFLEPSALDVEKRQRLRSRFEELTSGRGDFSYRLLFRKGGKFIGANALALPSGAVILTDELVERAADPQEVEAVLAHEIGHVVKRHGVRQILHGSMLTLGILLLTGDPSSLTAVIPVMLVQTGYSRDFEREADDYAYRYMLDNGIPLSRFVSIMEKLEQEHSERKGSGQRDHGKKWSYYLSTHPPTDERLERFR
jgi:Zn-dependent protease with chaperone function